MHHHKENPSPHSSHTSHTSHNTISDTQSMSIKRIDNFYVRNGQYEAGNLVAKIEMTETELEMIKCPKLHSAFVSNVRNMFCGQNYMRKQEFEFREKQLHKYCLKGSKDKHRIHNDRQLGMKLIDDIIERASSNYITPPHVVSLIWSFMSCMHHFQLRIKTGDLGFVHKIRTHTVKRVMATFPKLIAKLDPALYIVVLSSILTFYRAAKIWEFEFACRDLILDLLAVHPDVDDAITYILDTAVELIDVDFNEARQVFHILYDILLKAKWRTMSLVLMERLLNVYETFAKSNDTDPLDYIHLKRSLELSLQNAINNFDNDCLMNMIMLCLQRLNSDAEIDDQLMLDIGNIAIHAASKYKISQSFIKALPQETVTAIFELYRKRKLPGLLVSSKILRQLLDRNKNIDNFKTPKIFFQGTNYALVVPNCTVGDKKFIKALEHTLYDILYNAFVLAQTRMHLELLYQITSLYLVEIPCGYTATIHVSLLMSLQQYAFDLTKTNLIKSHYIHAIILSVMSLICYTKNAEVLYAYVVSIFERRAEWAPHLNPPLLHTYQYAEHHTLWNKPNLFFHDWEVGYGLWKCFRQKTKQKKSNKKERDSIVGELDMNRLDEAI